MLQRLFWKRLFWDKIITSDQAEMLMRISDKLETHKDRLSQCRTSRLWLHEQHKDASAARQSRDHKDTQALLHFFYRRNPFLGDGKLRSLATGQEADESVNVDMAKQIGQNILDSMT
ncbi:hypothetical protein ACOMHN_064020 [Nucella lapillus]